MPYDSSFCPAVPGGAISGPYCPEGITQEQIDSCQETYYFAILNCRVTACSDYSADYEVYTLLLNGVDALYVLCVAAANGPMERAQCLANAVNAYTAYDDFFIARIAAIEEALEECEEAALDAFWDCIQYYCEGGTMASQPLNLSLAGMSTRQIIRRSKIWKF